MVYKHLCVWLKSADFKDFELFFWLLLAEDPKHSVTILDLKNRSGDFHRNDCYEP